MSDISTQEETQSTTYLSVVIPAYNEEKRLPSTLADVIKYLTKQKYTSEILVIDDGSKDNTVKVVEDIAAKATTNINAFSGIKKIAAMRYPDGANHGKGYAVRYGMTNAEGKYRVFMDADNSTTIDHVERFFPFFKEQDFDIVIGSRDLNESDVEVHQAWYKEVAGDLGNMLIRAVAVRGIYDTQAGFKMFTAKAADKIFPKLTIDRWGFDVEMLAVAQKFGFKIKEAPIVWLNDPNSRVSAKAYIEVLTEVFRVRMNLWRHTYDDPVHRTI